MQTNEISSAAKTVIGTVISDKMNKTIVVMVERIVKDPRYGKFIRKRSKMHAHDENHTAKSGDTVRIRETRPYSKMKSWVLVEVVP